MFANRVCFVDLETTGASPARERVTEVGIVAVDRDGDAFRVTEWSSLVNPDVPIPSDIQWLTGITNDMVRAAPRFTEIADELLDRLRDAVCVAHNARFDYGFLRAEFTRLGIAWRAPLLCTVRLSRLLYPDRAPHSLDALIARFDLEGEQRHRALGDARVIWRFLQRLYERLPRDEVDQAIERLLSRPNTPPHLAPEALDGLPHAPGVYLFYGLNAHPIYIGKSIGLRERVAQHFNSDHARNIDARLAQEVRRLEWEETAGEIGALLREAQLVRTQLPAHNIALRRKANAVVFALDAGSRPRFIPASDLPLERAAEFYGPFSSRAAGRRLLIDLASAHGLSLKTMGLEGRGAKSAPDAPCFNHQLQRCRGGCIGAETRDQHRARLLSLLEEWRVPAWPYEGPIALIERDDARFAEDLHVIDRWCWLGSVKTLEAAQTLTRAAARSFDPDVFRIARTALTRAAAGASQVIELDAGSPGHG